MTHGFISVQAETFTVWWRWDWAAGFRGSSPQLEKEDPLSRASLVGPEEDGDDHFLSPRIIHSGSQGAGAYHSYLRVNAVLHSAPLNHSLVYLSRVNYN